MSSEQQPRPPIHVEVATNPGDQASAMAIREIVFIEEQQVPPEDERDEEDVGAFHLLAYEGKHAVGTGRLVILPEPPDGESGHWGRVGRMAVLASSRGHGIGELLLQSLEHEARRRKLDGIVVHSQLYARGFYEHEGYHDHGQVFEEAGIQHIQMRKRLSEESAKP
jgi:predicted GNAT family N-acyltransferase